MKVQNNIPQHDHVELRDLGIGQAFRHANDPRLDDGVFLIVDPKSDVYQFTAEDESGDVSLVLDFSGDTVLKMSGRTAVVEVSIRIEVNP